MLNVYLAVVVQLSNIMQIILKVFRSTEERVRMRELPYMQLIGSLLYLSCMSRPDIAFHMSILCSFMSNPSQECYDAAIALLLYCGATKHKALRYTGCTDQFPGLDRDALKPAIVDNQGFHHRSNRACNRLESLRSVSPLETPPKSPLKSLGNQ